MKFLFGGTGGRIALPQAVSRLLLDTAIRKESRHLSWIFSEKKIKAAPQASNELYLMKNASMNSGADVTNLLQAGLRGDRASLDAVMPWVYSELRSIAGGLWANQLPGHTLQPTALINEAYLKMARSGRKIENRTHFFALAAVAMRHVLINHAKANLSLKRGGGGLELALTDDFGPLYMESQAVVDLHEALERLEKLEPRYSRVVELRFFGGLGWEEIALELNISSKTVTRDWQAARAWLAREVGFGTNA